MFEHQAGNPENEGFQIQEMAQIVASTLAMAGLDSEELSPLVFLMGHGSSTSNNPFQQAYGCGACGGSSGAPNARVFAKMANHPEVRAELKKQNIVIPEGTWFVGAWHDTSSDHVDYSDVGLVPTQWHERLDRARQQIETAAFHNAAERARAFHSYGGPPGDLKQSKAHVESRVADLAQVRPEYGHSRVLLAYFGEREWIKSMSFDRRSFLVSYSASKDPDGSPLKGILEAALPVCANINLDYFFSRVDDQNFGSGTKPPLNVAGLLGVVMGGSSDLRIGLARQMTELHEPMRILCLVQAHRAQLDAVLLQHPRLRRLIENRWIRMIRVDPLSRVLEAHTSQGWQLCAGDA